MKVCLYRNNISDVTAIQLQPICFMVHFLNAFNHVMNGGLTWSDNISQSLCQVAKTCDITGLHTVRKYHSFICILQCQKKYNKKEVKLISQALFDVVHARVIFAFKVQNKFASK